VSACQAAAASTRSSTGYFSTAEDRQRLEDGMTQPQHDLSKLRIDRDASPAVRRAFGRSLILFLVAVGLLAAVWFVARTRGAVEVQVAVAEAMTGGAAGGGGTAVTANGYVVARTRASVSAKVAGRLAYLGVSEGSFVRRGDVIARLENADYQAQVTQAEANLALARAQVIEATSDRDQRQREVNRLRQIRSQNAELVSEQDLDRAESALTQAEARAQAAVARVEAAEAGLRFARASLENTLVRAPFTGTVLRKEAEVGEVVAPSVGGGLTRGAVVTMADLTTLEVEMDVNEAYIARVRNGQPAGITLDAYPDTSFRGEIRQVVPTADRQRATVQVKVSILDRDPRILPEMGVRVDVIEPTSAAAPVVERPRVRVPAAAVRDEGGRTVVWLVRQGRLESRAVEAGPVSAGFREIRSGLAGGEMLLVGGVEAPKAGMRVNVPGAP
jgi:RND family efflux transporter MFP subunit